MQKNLVFVIGLSPRLADPEVLKKKEYFGKYRRIYKVVINNHTVYNGAQVNLGERGGGGGEEEEERIYNQRSYMYWRTDTPGGMGGREKGEEGGRGGWGGRGEHLLSTIIQCSACYYF